MLNAILASLPTAARVTTQILSHFAAGRVRRVEQRDQGVFLVYLVDGMAEAMLQTDGSLMIQELEVGV